VYCLRAFIFASLHVYLCHHPLSHPHSDARYCLLLLRLLQPQARMPRPSLCRSWVPTAVLVCIHPSFPHSDALTTPFIPPK
jgi:hypothetical protein